MEIPQHYKPDPLEDKWYAAWEKAKCFKSTPDERESFTITIPPPNVTGVLHMGHILNNTIQDIMIRKARMSGYNACWVPGTDHASIATEAKVVKKLADEGISKDDISREEFMEHAHAWKDKYGGVILQQLRKLGASCDWDRTRFTMEESLSKSVIKVFVDLYNKGLMYRGYRMTNWDVSALTAVSDEEVYHKEQLSKLYHIRYQVEGSSDEWVTIATTRPETILGDSAVCFHPEDERYTKYHDARLLIPLIERSIPCITDDYVEPEFGTGALKVTPAHDINDYEIGKRHKLETINILDERGCLNKRAQLFVGEDRFQARKSIVKELEAKGHIVKVEELSNKVGYSERTHVVIEPRLTIQWFLKMEELAKPALENVLNDTIKFVPAHQKNTYRHWMENIRDWCISRQLWWGQRIPVYYLDDERFVCAETPEAALQLAQEKYGKEITAAELKQDEDVVDTWFSSWLWPISVFDGFENKEELDYYYPGKAIVTAPDIMFFWVARMIMAGYEYMDAKPFEAVYYTGVVRDPQGRKMSKSLGNSPDPLDLIAEYGADSLRVGILLCSPAGGDLLFDPKLCEQGRNFCNKMWNACRLIKGWEINEGGDATRKPAIDWFRSRLNSTLATLENQFEQYRFSEALKNLYSFVWNDFCSDYLEMIKPEYGDAIDQETYDATVEFYEAILKMLHPFMPFISEEIYHILAERKEGEFIMMADYPATGEIDTAIMASGDRAKDIITNIRNARTKNGLSAKDRVVLHERTTKGETNDLFTEIIKRKGGISSYEETQSEIPGAVGFMSGKTEFFLDLGIELDLEAEKARIEEELKYLNGFKVSVNKKLGNERFVNNAPPVVIDKERKKLADAEEKIKLLEDSLAKLN
ncbi:valine--tRNA ligase [Chitinophagales bacterium]|nr:valine--tRNA ligase [Chitinophagales bacterium]